MIQTIGEHTVDTSLLTGEWCIDVGCRGFGFSKGVRDLGELVLAYDVDDLEDPKEKDIFFIRSAVSNYDGSAVINFTRDKQATNIIGGKINGEESAVVNCIDLNAIYKRILSAKKIDVLKLDCEGSEYHILSDPNFNPVPLQITVEFHEHCQKQLHDQLFEKCKENLLKYYTPIKFDRYAAHGAGMNYWDCLFVRKDIKLK